MQKKNRNKILNFLLKLFLVLLFLVFLYRQVFFKNDPQVLLSEFLRSLGSQNFLLFLLAFFLALINWSLEALKWKLLMSPYKHYYFFTSVKTIFSGIAAGIITPLQLGEYFGRVAVIDQEQKWRSLWATLTGSIAQNIFTVFAGISGFLYILRHSYNVDNFILLPSLLLGIAGVILLLVLYYNLGFALKLASKLNMKKLIAKIKRSGIHPEYNSFLLNKVLILSCLRYIVFTTQFCLMLIFFGLDMNIIALISGVSTVFLLQTGIPLPPAANFIARGGLAILIFSQNGANEIMILSSTFSLWFINLVIPSLIGLLILMKENIVKNLGYDD